MFVLILFLLIGSEVNKVSLCLNPQCLMISSAARRQCTLGEIINLVSADTQKLMDFVVYFNSIWVNPIEIALCFYFLWQVKPIKMTTETHAQHNHCFSKRILIYPISGH